jgi:hypothetical protein
LGEGLTTDLTIDLKPPSHAFRRIVIDRSHMTIDFEFAAAADPHNYTDFNGPADQNPGTATHASRHFDCVAENDVLRRLILTFDLNTDDSVTVKTTLRCYDSSEADTDDYDEGSLDAFLLPAGKTSHWEIFVEGDNRAGAWFTAQNINNQS